MINDIRLIHQISRVLRMQKGEQATLLDNLGNEFLVEIGEISMGQVSGKIIDSAKKTEKVRRKIILYQSLLKKDNFELVLQKCTELGVAYFQPIITERTIKVKDEVPERWLDIVREAAEQSERIFIPEILKPRKFFEALKLLNKDAESFLAYEEAHEPHLSKELSKLEKQKSVNLFIGPEGGFSGKEIELAKENGVKIVSLGPLILKSETAAVTVSVLGLLDYSGHHQLNQPRSTHV